MIKSYKSIFILATALIILLGACRKKASDEYYGRPDSLEPPIYQVLESKGRFNNLLAIIDKSGYKNTLAAAGYWTFFAPNDDAFQKYFTEKGISGVDQLDSAACQKIVTYSLVYNAFSKERIDDFQSNTGWVENSAFRRRTASYKGVYSTTNLLNQPILAIASNRNNNGTVNYVDADQNNKYLSIFTDIYFGTQQLSSEDYKYFYPNSTFSGFNVDGAAVLEKDIAAENGIIHEIDHVIVELPSIDDYLGTNPEYSEFKKLFDKYMVEYVLNETATLNYNNRGFSGQVYTKVFNYALAYSLNNENYLKTQDNDGQTNAYTLFAPTNDALTSYVKNTLLENYPAGSTLDDVPRQIVYDFINAHMWQSVVWPSRFETTLNFLNEEARFDPATDVVDKKMLSNGVFYGTKKVQEADVFTTVYGRAYLDPKYSKMVELMAGELRPVITLPSQKFTVFMISDQQIIDAGYVQNRMLSNDPNQQWVFTPPPGSNAIAVSGTSAYQRLLRILRMCVVSTPNGELNDLSGSGVAETYGSEFIKYSGNKIQGAGNVDDSLSANNWVNITGSKESVNGKVYYCDKLPLFTELPIIDHIKRVSSDPASPNYSFWMYLSNATYDNFYVPSTGAISGIASGTFYTVLIPDTAAIRAAVNDGVLPGTGTPPNMVPNFTPTSAGDREKVKSFIAYHIISKKTVGTDGLTSGAFGTLLNSQATGDPLTIFINNTKGKLEFKDVVQQSTTPPPAGYRAETVSGHTDYLSNRCLIHTINNYLRHGL